MRMLSALIPLLASLCGSCSGRPMLEIEKLSYQVIARHAEEYQQCGFSVFGTGTAMPVRLNSLFIDYIVSAEADVQKARGMIVPMVLRMLELTNNNPPLRQYMCKYPFTAENARIGLGFRDAKGRCQNPPSLVYASAIAGTIAYYYQDPLTKQYSIYYEEDFDAAVEKVQGSGDPSSP